MKPLASIIETVTKEPTITYKSADGKFIVREQDKNVRITYWFDGDSALANDATLTTLILQVIRTDCQWVINIFNNDNLKEQVKHYNEWLEVSQENIFVPSHIRAELNRKKKISKLPDKSEFNNWLAKELAPIYQHIINNHKHVDLQTARQIVVDLMKSFYPEHQKIQNLNEDSLEKAFLRTSTTP